MIRIFIGCIIIIVLGCDKRKTSPKPIWVNANHIIEVPKDTLFFKTNEIGWKAILYSFIQPIELEVKEDGAGFSIHFKHNSGVVEGPANLVLYNEYVQCSYSVYLKNKTREFVVKRDYRSPKTVNPDSSLKQHRIIHQYDEWRNIVSLQNDSLFYEDLLAIDPIVGTYRAQEDIPLSSYYVQPGSSIDVPVEATFSNEKGCFLVNIGPLKDAYNNTVADGTLLTLIYTDGLKTYQKEVQLLNGIVEAYICESMQSSLTLTVKVNEKRSKSILLSRKQW